MGLMALGALLFVLDNLFWLYFIPYQTVWAFLLAIVGAATAFVPRSISMCSSEHDIDEAVALATKNYAEETAESVGLENSLIRTIKSTVIGNYTYDTEKTLVRRGKDDRKLRTTAYTASALLFTKNGIYIAQKTFSLVDDFVSESSAEFTYEEMDEVSVFAEEYTFADGGKVQVSYFVITAAGKESMRLPTASGAAIDKLCDDINHMIKSAK